MDNEVELQRVSKRTYRIKARRAVREPVERAPQSPRFAGFSRFATTPARARIDRPTAS
jgi:hypothetical protein